MQENVRCAVCGSVSAKDARGKIHQVFLECEEQKTAVETDEDTGEKSVVKTDCPAITCDSAGCQGNHAATHTKERERAAAEVPPHERAAQA